MVERQISNLNVAGSIPATRSKKYGQAIGRQWHIAHGQWECSLSIFVGECAG